MRGFMVAWRGDSGISRLFVPEHRASRTDGGLDIRAGSQGVAVGGVEIPGGGAARVEGLVMSCLNAASVDRSVCEVSLGRMVGASVSSIETMHHIASACMTRAPVLILGESGTGKELVADIIGAGAGSVHALNMGAVPVELAEAELFGFNRGAFTGAVEAREGALEAAKGGVLFLDELAESPGWVQAKLLRAIDSGCFRRLGSTRDIPFKARVVAATNVDPVDGVADGRLRLDLLERLGCHVIRLAPLRNRPADIPCLVRLFASRHGGDRFQVAPASADVIDLMRRWPWPGNVRELGNVVARVLLVSSSGLTDPALVREAMEAGRFLAAPYSVAPPQSSSYTTRQQEICESDLPRSTYYYRLKRGRIPSDTGPRRAPSSAALKT